MTTIEEYIVWFEAGNELPCAGQLFTASSARHHGYKSVTVANLKDGHFALIFVTLSGVYQYRTISRVLTQLADFDFAET
jgi:hypothetical protein